MVHSELQDVSLSFEVFTRFPEACEVPAASLCLPPGSLPLSRPLSACGREGVSPCAPPSLLGSLSGALSWRLAEGWPAVATQLSSRAGTVPLSEVSTPGLPPGGFDDLSEGCLFCCSPWKSELWAEVTGGRLDRPGRNLSVGAGGRCPLSWPSVPCERRAGPGLGQQPAAPQPRTLPCLSLSTGWEGRPGLPLAEAQAPLSPRPGRPRE